MLSCVLWISSVINSFVKAAPERYYGYNRLTRYALSTVQVHRSGSWRIALKPRVASLKIQCSSLFRWDYKPRSRLHVHVLVSKTLNLFLKPSLSIYIWESQVLLSIGKVVCLQDGLARNDWNYEMVVKKTTTKIKSKHCERNTFIPNLTEFDRIYQPSKAIYSPWLSASVNITFSGS